MKSLYLLFICCLGFICHASAQTADNKVEAKLIELRKAGVDTIILYHSYCIGGALMAIDSADAAKCHPNNEKYLFWADKGINYVQRFDECYNYNTIKDKSTLVIQLIKFHFLSLKKERIKPVKFRQMYKGKMQTLITSIDHSCYADIDFYIGKKVSKFINDFALDTKFVDDKKNQPNINYSYNQHTYLKQLKDMVEKEIAELKFLKLSR